MSMTGHIYNALKGDRYIWLVYALLTMLSMLAVYSAAGSMAYKLNDGNVNYYLIKHGMIILLGIALTFACYRLHYMQYSRWAPLLFLVGLLLLGYTMVFGMEINDARRWIKIPIIHLSFQTSDFARLALIIYVARVISSRQDNIKDFKGAFRPIIVPIGLMCGVIALADLSTAALLFVTCTLMMIVGRVHLKYIGLLIVVGIVLFGFLVGLGSVFDVIRLDTWTSRMNEFVNGISGYQVTQSKIAIANGEWIGQGPGNSIQRNYLPYPYADFIYAIICEEYGLIGGISVIVLFCFLMVRCTGIVTRCPKAFGAMLAMGLCMNIVLQAFANIAVSVHLVPVTGLNLPLVSMGGTSILFSSISLGIILSVSRYIEEVRGSLAAEEAMYEGSD